jgi:hypothetical protein
MLFELVVCMRLITFHFGVPYCPIHVFDLPISLRMVGFGEAMVDSVVAAEAIKEMRGQHGGRAGTTARSMTELTPSVRMVWNWSLYRTAQLIRLHLGPSTCCLVVSYRMVN